MHEEILLTMNRQLALSILLPVLDNLSPSCELTLVRDRPTLVRRTSIDPDLLKMLLLPKMLELYPPLQKLQFRNVQIVETGQFGGYDIQFIFDNYTNPNLYNELRALGAL